MVLLAPDTPLTAIGRPLLSLGKVLGETDHSVHFSYSDALSSLSMHSALDLVGYLRRTLHVEDLVFLRIKLFQSLGRTYQIQDDSREPHSSRFALSR